MLADKWYNASIFISCEWSVGTRDNEKKKKNKRPRDTLSYRYRRHCSSHFFLCSFVFFFLYTRVYNNVEEVAVAAVKVSAVSQHT